MMNKYESIIIVNPNLDEVALKALEEKLILQSRYKNYLLFLEEIGK